MGDFTSNGHLVHLGYGLPIGRINMGSSIRYIKQKLDSETSSAISASLGTQFKIDKTLQAGMSLNNITLKKAKYIKDSAELPREFRVGLFYEGVIFERKLGVGFDFVKANDTDYTVAFGTELNIHQVVSLRLGYNTYSDINAFSMGVGINISKILIDFTYKPSELFGQSYRVGFGYKIK